MKYQNLDNVKNEHSFNDMLRWSKERKAKKKDLSIKIEQQQTKEIDMIKNNRTDFSITWVGHSTFLIQINGLNIITDPVWAKWMGVQTRLTEPGIAINELPEIDIVFISHSHYDHLDFNSIKRLKGNPKFYVPVGLKSKFVKKGYQNVVECEWWEKLDDKGLIISFVPAQHWTKRTVTDTNSSHWGGWIIEDKKINRSVYFVGDTGYFRGFKEIEKKFNIDIVLMPIGAYEPEWFMSVSHINPENAIKAFLELKGKTFIPMHYGAYRLADDTGPEALERLYKEWERLQLNNTQLRILKHGETIWTK
jgi:L-ascorbate metabolism protein UlaG (beta-lactamase superfamily)